jgi:SAM-dependent methyltransferase
MIHGTTTSAQFFERKYLHQEDPWSFATDPYEQTRYTLIVEALAGRRYQRGFEPGCSVGVLTEALSSLCEEVYAFDFSPTAVERSRLRCAHLDNVVIDCRELDHTVQLDGADLAVLSEVGYYFTADQWSDIVRNIVSQLPLEGTLLAAHWLGESEDHIMSGDQVHQLLMKQGGLRHELGRRFTGFRLDRWIRKA